MAPFSIVGMSRCIIVLIVAALAASCDLGGGGSRLCALSCNKSKSLEPVVIQNPAITVSVTTEQAVTEGDVVTLTASASHSRGWSVSYSWSQERGPAVKLQANYSEATFVAPAVNVSTVLEFRATASDKAGTVDTRIATVTVQPKRIFSPCQQPPVLATIFVWADHGCTTDGSSIAGDTLIATIYRQEETEPNNSFGTSNPVSFPEYISGVRVGANIIGSRHSDRQDNDDFFIFTPQAAGHYYLFTCDDATICDRGSNTDVVYLSLKDQNFNEVEGTQAGILQIQEMSVVLDAGLPYYVGVHTSDSMVSTYEYNMNIVNWIWPE
jgi:hypothetical protein